MKTIQTLFALLLLSLQLFSANTIVRDQVKERKIEEQLKAIDSSLVPVFVKATNAMDKNDLTLADSLFMKVVKKAPRFDPALRRLGGVRMQVGYIKDAIKYCDSAVAVNRSAYNLLSLALCYNYTDRGHKAPEENLGKALDLLEEAQTLPDGNDISILVSIGQISLELNLEQRFRSATKALRRNYPDEMITHYFGAIVEAADENWLTSEKEIYKAQELGLDEESVQTFLNSGVKSKARNEKVEYGFLGLAAFWVVGLFILFVMGKILSNLTLSSIERNYRSGAITEKGRTLRKIYKVLINVGGVYYYFSLPFILVGVIALAGGLIYFFLLVGRIPIGITIALVIGSCVTIYWMIRTLTFKVNYKDPGRALKPEEAPRLFDLAAEVAKTIGTRTIDEIRITPLCDLAVYERGKWREQMKDKTRRVLILGAGVVKDFRTHDFRAVLAHEYGHFSHRDTAGGAVALRMRNNMFQYYRALFIAGQALWWNLAFQFLRLYNFIFRRISHGATRLQEVLADRVAAQTYGKEAFKNGLTYVIKREIEFQALANFEIEEAKLAERKIFNLYEISGGQEQTIEEELNKQMNARTTEDDTHPCPADRFRYVDALTSKEIYDDDTYLRDLFADWNAITMEMTSIIESRVKKG